MSDLSFEAWWAYVVKHEIEPTMRAYGRPPLVTEPLRWPCVPAAASQSPPAASNAPQREVRRREKAERKWRERHGG